MSKVAFLRFGLCLVYLVRVRFVCVDSFFEKVSLRVLGGVGDGYFRFWFRSWWRLEFEFEFKGFFICVGVRF